MRRLATLGLVIAAAALTAAGQLTITTNPMLPTAVIGQPYPQVALQTTADPGPLMWSFAESGPPNFLVVSPAFGFANQSHFSRVFTRQIGTSPSAWRRHSVR